MDEPEFVKTFFQCFAAQSRAKKLKDNQARGKENEITELFLDSAGCKPIKKISVMADTRQLENSTFVAISEIIKRSLQPKKKTCHGGKNQIYVH